MAIADRLFASLLNGLAPTACLDCGRRVPDPDTPFCSVCCGRLPWWRAIDGCPRCGFGGGALPTLERFESAHPSAKTTRANPFESAIEDFASRADAACPGCYAEGSALDWSYTLLRYVGSAHLWIPQFKHHTSPFGPPLGSRLAIDFCADELARLLARRIARGRLEAPGMILPIPLHPRRHRRRGFNQSHWIAERVGRRLAVPVAARTLVRVRDTPAQALRDSQARRANLRRAFVVADDATLPTRVWMVDDVLTTGATLDSAAESLLARGVDQVVAITLAATPPLPWPRIPPRTQHRTGR